MRNYFKNIAIITLTACLMACNESTKVEIVEPEVVETKLYSEENITCILESQDCPALTPLDSAVAHIKAYAEAWNNVPLPYNVGTTEANKSKMITEKASVAYPTFAYGISVGDMIAAFDLKVVDGKIVSSCDYIRAYVGIEGVTKRQHLYFTPIGQDGEDSLMSCGENQYVMELTTPCPNTCGVNSPLFEAFNDNLNAERKAGYDPVTIPIGPPSENCVVD